ncbi:serine/threonine-protein kinase [Paraliomyxa miuraensis]|uniref:serine/threonine-protein kinase n=1 Tax=Paraliomyxa miuraensis TaxID=376150 RepID=UPI00225AFF0C|nr:serine/threonine-protein kinase [Paraliomyxa miuraensis]MCX4247501.1 serine/threonine protein kinase [Paraliomyxa miuraensis]
MTTPSFDLRSHRPAIEADRIDDLRRRLFGGASSRPQVPGYTIEEELGSGAFGRVYLAFDPRFQRRVALKVIAVDSPNARVRIEREAHALARLSHPNVVQVYDKGPAGAHGYFLALEYVDGPDLQQWLEQAPRSLSAILTKFLEVAEGLSAAHRAGLVHRDLKPANVIVGSDGRVRLLDFGLARADETSLTSTSGTDVLGGRPLPTPSVDDPSQSIEGDPIALHESDLARPITARGRFVGTPSYAAPEQHLGTADARSDQYGFCVALFEAVYGRRPPAMRRGAHHDKPLHAVPIDFNPGKRRIPRWLVALLRQGLAFDPNERHPDMATIGRELRHRLSTRPARVRGAWLAAGTAAATAMLMTVSGAIQAEAVQACRQDRQGWPTAWVEHRTAIRTELPELGNQLDDWSTHWSSTRQSTCHEPEPERSSELDACLDAGATGLGHLVRWLGTADRSTWQALREHPGPSPLAGLVETLPDPIRCATGSEPRTTPAARAAWDHLLAARMELAAGHGPDAEREATLATEQARALGDRGLRAAAEHTLLLAGASRKEPREAIAILPLLVRALEAGERTLAADIAASSLTLHAMGRLSSSPVTPSTEQSERLASELAALRTAALATTPDPAEDPAVAGWLRTAEGNARLLLGDAAGAQALYREAASLLRQASPQVSPAIVALVDLQEAIAISAQKPYARAAIPRAARAVAEREAVLGSTHPAIAHERHILGEISMRADDIEGALRHYTDAAQRFEALEMTEDQAFSQAEIVHAHRLAARRARHEAQDLGSSGADPTEAWAEFERRRHLALRETLVLERLAMALLADESIVPARASERARMWVLAVASYAYHPSCWDPMLKAAERLERVCEHLDGADPSCLEGQRLRQRLLEQGKSAPATNEGCVPKLDGADAPSGH